MEYEGYLLWALERGSTFSKGASCGQGEVCLSHLTEAAVPWSSFFSFWPAIWLLPPSTTPTIQLILYSRFCVPFLPNLAPFLSRLSKKGLCNIPKISRCDVCSIASEDAISQGLPHSRPGAGPGPSLIQSQNDKHFVFYQGHQEQPLLQLPEVIVASCFWGLLPQQAISLAFCTGAAAVTTLASFSWGHS